MKQESIDFITLLAARAHPQTTNIYPFDHEHWFQGAYRTIQRNVPKGIFATDAKHRCRDQIFAALPLLTAANFDASMKELVESLSREFPITIGQSQKLVNIVLKYYACLFFSERAPTWARENSWVGAIHPLQHVPIDSIVMFGLCRNTPAECAGFVTASSRFAFNTVTKCFGWSHAASIFVPDSPDGLGPSVPWSGIADYAVYFRLQTIVRTLADEKRISPLLYEMRFLWAPA